MIQLDHSYNNLKHFTFRERLHLELEYSRVAVPFNSTYSPKPTLMTSCPIISIVSELRHAHCCRSSYQSNSRSCLGTTRVGVKVQMTQFIGSLLSLSLLLYELWYQMKSPRISYRIIKVYKYETGLSYCQPTKMEAGCTQNMKQRTPRAITKQ